MAKWISHPGDNRETRLVPVFRRSFQVKNGLVSAAHYAALSAKIKAAYDKYLIGPDGTIQRGHQAAYIRALALDMVSERRSRW